MRIFAHFDVKLFGFDQYFPRSLGHFPPGVNIDIVAGNQQNPDLGRLLGRIACCSETQRHNTT